MSPPPQTEKIWVILKNVEKFSVSDTVFSLLWASSFPTDKQEVYEWAYWLKDSDKVNKRLPGLNMDVSCVVS